MKIRILAFLTSLLFAAGLASHCKNEDDSDDALLLGLAIASIPCGDIVVDSSNASSTVDAPTSSSSSGQLKICSPGVSTSMTIRFSETGVYRITAAGGKLRFVCSGADGSGSLPITITDASGNTVVSDTGLVSGFGLVDTGEWVQRRMTAGSTLTLTVPQAVVSGTCGFSGTPGLRIDAAAILTIDLPAPAISPPDNRALIGGCDNFGGDANLCRDRYVFTDQVSFGFSCSAGETAYSGQSCRTARSGTPLGMCRVNSTSNGYSDYLYYTGFASDPETHCRDTLNGFFSDGF